MSSSLEDEFNPPNWATKDEVTKAARHYINYWKVEAQHRNGQWLDELEKKAKAMGEAALLMSQLEEARYEAEKWQRAEHAVGAKLNEVCLEAISIKDELEKLRMERIHDINQIGGLQEENARLKESLRLEIERAALAQIGFKMYQDNVDSGGLHKDRKDAIARLEAEIARLKAEVERLTKEKGEFKEMTYIKGWAGIDKDETPQGIEILKQLKAKQGGQP